MIAHSTAINLHLINAAPHFRQTGDFPPFSGRTVRRLRAHFSAQHIHKRRTKLAQHRQQQLYKIWRRQINEQNTHACTSVTHSHSGQIYRHGTGSVHGEKKLGTLKAPIIYIAAVSGAAGASLLIAHIPL